MGYVKYTEKIGELSTTYEFESYDDFKDWKSKSEESFVEIGSGETFVEIGRPVFQVGDKVKFVQQVEDFRVGDVGYVRTLNDDGTVDSIWTADKEDYWYVEQADFVRFEE